MAACALNYSSSPSLHQPRLIRAENHLESLAPSDDAIVEAAKNGEVGAFAKLVERHQQFCFSKAYSILRNRSEAEEEVQAAWVQAWTHLASYQGHGSFRAWLNRILSNQCLMQLRKAKYAPMTSIDEVFNAEGSFRLEVIDQRALPEEAMGDGQLARVVMQEINRVPPLLREVLIMRDVRQLVMKDIATHLQISIPAAKSRLMRARLELKSRLARHQGERKGYGTLLQKPGRCRAAYVRAS
jgi:RNA polymerase sigma-70 factor, ECF subfamily